MYPVLDGLGKKILEMGYTCISVGLCLTLCIGTQTQGSGSDFKVEGLSCKRSEENGGLGSCPRKIFVTMACKNASKRPFVRFTGLHIDHLPLRSNFVSLK